MLSLVVASQPLMKTISIQGIPLYHQPAHAFPGTDEHTATNSSLACASTLLTSPTDASLTDFLRLSLGKLDLSLVPPRKEHPSGPSASGFDYQELGRRSLLYKYEAECSCVADNLFVSSEVVARKRDLLLEHGITHIVNTIGSTCPNAFPETFTYHTIQLLDSPKEDILPILYDVIAFIDGARNQGGNVLVHCSQGVSRSATLAIAYLMWHQNTSYEETLALVKAARAIANPNIGFTCQLLQWYRRRAQPLAPRVGPRPLSPMTSSPLPSLRVYRIAPHSTFKPTYLVPKPILPHPVGEKLLAILDDRVVLVLHHLDGVYVWRGKAADDVACEAGLRAAAHLGRFELAGATIVVCSGSEPEPFWRELGRPPGEQPGEGWQPGECAAYDEDVDLYQRGLTGWTQAMSMSFKENIT